MLEGNTFTVLSWNVQFCAGRRCCFFYDGGADSRVSPPEVEETLRGIITVIERYDPDIVLLQEVDRDSRRTGGIDQHARLATALGLPVVASTPYFKVPFVPVPPHAPMGRVDMHLSVFSRFALGPGLRTRLSPLDEPRWRRAFNLRRAILELPLLTSSGPIRLLNTHLSAFSRGDGTLDRQVATVLGRCPDSPVLLAGDFNSLPPGDEPSRLGEAQVLYSDEHTPIQPLYDMLDVAFPTSPRDRTYVPYGTNLPDRTIDYLFSRQLECVEATALAEGAEWSDHLPVLATFRR